MVRRQVDAALGFELRGGPAEVILVNGLARMREEAGAAIHEWAAGICQGSRSRIILRSDLVTGGGPLRSMVTTLRHEWVHLSWSRRAGAHTRRLPLWLEEGIAEEIGGGVSVDAGAQLDFAAAFGRLIPLEELERSWPSEADRAGLAYRQGRSWVQFFRDKSGWDRLQRILAELADGGGVKEGPAAGTPFQELVYQHSGFTLSHWNATWQVHLEETSDPWFHLVLRDLTWSIFVLLALFSLVAYVFLRRRRRRQIAELPDYPLPGEIE